jgi:tetratricopeptide (TPR) repeat protein
VITLAIVIVTSVVVAARVQTAISQHRETTKAQAYQALKSSFNAGVKAARSSDRKLGLEQLLIPMAEIASDRERNQPEVAAELFNDIGDGYLQLDRSGQALPHLEHALSLLDSLENPDEKMIGTVLHNLGRALYWQDDHARAVQRYEQARATRRAAFGAMHKDVATTIDHLGNCRREQGRFAEAESLMREALAMRRRVLDPSDPEIGHSLNNIATVLVRQERWEEAESLVRSALELISDNPDKPDLRPRVLRVHARTLIELGRLDEAQAVLDESQRLADLGLDQGHRDHARMKLSWSRLALARGELAEAQELCLRAAEVLESKLGPDHLDTAESRLLLGQILLAKGDPAGAEAPLRDAVRIRQARMPRGECVTTSMQIALGECLLKLRKLEEAENLLLESHQFALAGFGAAHPRTLQAISHLVDLYLAMQQPEKAEHYRRLLSDASQ